MRGLFISFEGVEGSGKTTQAALLAEYLRNKGFTVIKTEEPGGTPISVSVRKILLAPENRAMDPVTELLLYNAARVQHIKEIILPAVGRGDIVITDRFSDSTIAYQGFGRGIDLKLIDSLDLIATNRLRPDITFLLDIEASEGLARNRNTNKSDRIEMEHLSFHERVRTGFINLASKEQKRIRLINSADAVEKIHAAIVAVVDEFLQSR